MSEFDTFWATYPNRIGKLAAEKAYAKARKKATAAEILDGVARYIAQKPEWKEWCVPTTFLNQGRWMDEYAPVKREAIDADWWEECQRLHQGECGGDRMRHHVRKQLDAGKAS